MLGFYASLVWKKRLHKTKRPSKKSFPGRGGLGPFSPGPNFVCEWKRQTEERRTRNRTSRTPAQTQIVPHAKLCETAFARTNFNDKNELENAKAKPAAWFEF
jgi:hypothetical protein